MRYLLVLGAIACGLVIAQITSIPSATSGGTGTPGGSNGQIQYNNSGAFGGVAAPSGTIVGTTDTQTLSGKTYTSPSLGAGSSPVTETWTVGAGGVTANTLVQTDASAPLKIVAATTGAYGVAMSTVAAAGSVEVARFGTVNCVTDTGGATAGDLVILGTGSPIDCKDAGVTASSSVPVGARLIGVFRSSATAGNPALVELTPAHFGTQLAGVCTVTATTGAITLDQACGNGTGASSGNTIFKLGPLTGAVTLPTPSLKTGTFELQITNGASAQTVTIPSWLQNAAPFCNDASAKVIWRGNWDGTAVTNPNAVTSANGCVAASADSAVNPTSGLFKFFWDSTVGFGTRDPSGNLRHQSKFASLSKDLTINNTLTLAGTDNTTVTFAPCSKVGDIYSPLVNSLDSTDQLSSNGAAQYFSMNSGAPQLPSGFIVAGCHFTLHYMVDSIIGGTNSNITITPVLCDTPTCGTTQYVLGQASSSGNFSAINTTVGLQFTVECVGTAAANSNVSVLCGWNPPNGHNGGSGSSIVTITTNQILYPNLRYLQATQAGNKMSMLYNATTVP